MPEYFFIVGAQRSGTTYLYQRLADHPEIEMARPVRPEPKFFLYDHLYKQGIDFYHQTFFGEHTDGWLWGEKSTSYIESAEVPHRIMRFFPEAKIIMCLRDPVKRAISNYWFSFNNGLETLPLEQAMYQETQRRENYDHERISASPYAYIQRGHYINYIETYMRYVPRSQIKILIYEQLHQDPAVMQSLLNFLGVSPLDMPLRNEEPVVNASKKQDVILSEEFQQFLRDQFVDSNQHLAAFLDLDLKQWWSS